MEVHYNKQEPELTSSRLLLQLVPVFAGFLVRTEIIVRLCNTEQTRLYHYVSTKGTYLV